MRDEEEEDRDGVGERKKKRQIMALEDEEIGGIADEKRSCGMCGEERDIIC